MVLCIIALVVFGVLGIFSAKYRALAKEAFNCVFRMVTLRPCDSRFDEKLKAKILSKALSFSPALARFLNRNFAALSWIFTLLFFASLAYSAVSVYNYWAYGNCNGPNSNAFCGLDVIFNPGKEHSFGSVVTGIGPVLGGGNVTLVEFGCFACPSTKQAQPELKQFLAKHPEVRLEFRAFPLPSHESSHDAAEAAFCAQDQGRFWDYYDLLFEKQGSFSKDNFKLYALQLGLNSSKFNECFDTEKYSQRVSNDFEYGKNVGVFGTPTFFLGESVLVGPKTVDQFERALKEKVVDNILEGGSCPPPAGVK